MRVGRRVLAGLSSLLLVAGLAAPTAAQEGVVEPPPPPVDGDGELLPVDLDDPLAHVEVFDPVEVREAVVPDVSGLHLGDEVVNGVSGERVGEVLDARTLASKTFLRMTV